jgi:predicted unusual protein kinase regulating ubiquinone biosynthesis (AarF/ABC1/UbiB family)
MVKYAREQPKWKSKEEELNFYREMEDLFSSLREKPLREIEVGPFLRNAIDITRRYRVKLEGNFSTLCLGTVVLEGIGNLIR